MRKIMLNDKQNFKYETIKKLVDNNGNPRRAAVTLGISLRKIYRLINAYKAGGKQAFIHGNTARIPAIAYSPEVKQQVLDLYTTSLMTPTSLTFPK